MSSKNPPFLTFKESTAWCICFGLSIHGAFWPAAGNPKKLITSRNNNSDVTEVYSLYWSLWKIVPSWHCINHSIHTAVEKQPVQVGCQNIFPLHRKSFNLHYGENKPGKKTLVVDPLTGPGSIKDMFAMDCSGFHPTRTIRMLWRWGGNLPIFTLFLGGSTKSELWVNHDVILPSAKVLENKTHVNFPLKNILLKIIVPTKRKWKTSGALVRKTTAPTSRKTSIPSAPAGPCVVKKSQAFSRYLVQWNGLGPLLGCPRKLAADFKVDYNQLTNHSLSSSDIQVQWANFVGTDLVGSCVVNDPAWCVYLPLNLKQHPRTNKYKKGGGEAEVCQKQWSDV